MGSSFSEIDSLAITIWLSTDLQEDMGWGVYVIVTVYVDVAVCSDIEIMGWTTLLIIYTHLLQLLFREPDPRFSTSWGSDKGPCRLQPRGCGYLYMTRQDDVKKRTMNNELKSPSANLQMPAPKMKTEKALNRPENRLVWAKECCS